MTWHQQTAHLHNSHLSDSTKQKTVDDPRVLSFPHERFFTVALLCFCLQVFGCCFDTATETYCFTHALVMCVCVPSLVFAKSATRCFFCSLCHSHTRCPDPKHYNGTHDWYWPDNCYNGSDPTIAIPARCFCFFCHSPTGCLGPLLGLLMPAGFKNHLLFKTVQNTPLPFTARMPRRRNKQSGNRILTALRQLRIKIEPRSPVLLILPFKCKQIMKCKRIMKSDMSQYKERVELFSI